MTDLMQSGETKYPSLEMLLDGQWTSDRNKGYANVCNPSNNQELGMLPLIDDKSLTDVVSSAESGFKIWRASTLQQRSDLFSKTAKIISERLDEFSAVLTLEQGKPLAESSGEWLRVVDTFTWHAEAVREHKGTHFSDDNDRRIYQRFEPIGIAAAFCAWNFPALLPARKLAPALAAGCSMILKASEEAPASAILLLKAMTEAGLPPGVVNLVFGTPANISETLLRHSSVRKCSFTGSVDVGRELARLSSANLVRCTLELGGHAPVVVFNDCDLEQTLETIVPFRYRNAGQACIAPSRFYVQADIYPEFVKRFVDMSEGISVGDGFSADTVMGPMANSRGIESMKSFCHDAVEKGATCLLGGDDSFSDAELSKGFYWKPTVFTDVPETAALMFKETFGPITTISAFHDRDSVLEHANRLAYGLASYVFTESRKTADYMIQNIEAGGVALNAVCVMEPDTPFGGVKLSGYGYEGGHHGIEQYIQKKLVTEVFP